MPIECIVLCGVVAYLVVHLVIGSIYVGVSRGLDKTAYILEDGDDVGVFAALFWFILLPCDALVFIYHIAKTKTEAIVKASEERTRARNHEVPKWSEK